MDGAEDLFDEEDLECKELLSRLRAKAAQKASSRKRPEAEGEGGPERKAARQQPEATAEAFRAAGLECSQEQQQRLLEELQKAKPAVSSTAGRGRSSTRSPRGTARTAAAAAAGVNQP